MRSSSRPGSKVTFPHIPPSRLNMGGYTAFPTGTQQPQPPGWPWPKAPMSHRPLGVPEALLPPALVSPHPHHLVIPSPGVPAPGPALPALGCPVSPGGEPAAPVPAVLSMPSPVSPLPMLHHTLPYHPVYSVIPLEAPLPSAVTGAPGPAPRPRCPRCPHPGALRGSTPLPRCPRCSRCP